MEARIAQRCRAAAAEAVRAQSAGLDKTAAAAKPEAKPKAKLKKKGGGGVAAAAYEADGEYNGEYEEEA
eukprot:7816828-Alexandrium_andersonii.AAC.1